MKKFILSGFLLGALLTLTLSSHAGNFSVSFGSGWGYHSRPAYYYDDCAPTVVVYRPYPTSYYYQRPYYQRPVYQSYGGYGYSSAYRQGFQNGYSTAIRRATPVYRVERCERVYR